MSLKVAPSFEAASSFAVAFSSEVFSLSLSQLPASRPQSLFQGLALYEVGDPSRCEATIRSKASPEMGARRGPGDDGGMGGKGLQSDKNQALRSGRTILLWVASLTPCR